MDKKTHWENVYESKPVNRLGWYKQHLHPSLDWIKELAAEKGSAIIDVGGGASTLVDDLISEGYESITVVDLSGRALEHSKSRLGDKAARVKWIEGDITNTELPANYYALWHDRAVFHFLTDERDRRKYIGKLRNSLAESGYLIIGTFSFDAPPKCSGLPVERYDVEKMKSTLGDEFKLLDSMKELHVTPGGVEQMYLYCKFKRDSL